MSQLSFARVLAVFASLGAASAAAQTSPLPPAPAVNPPVYSVQRTVALPNAHLPPSQQLRWPAMSPGDTNDFSLNIGAYLTDALHDTIASYTAVIDAGNASDLTLKSQDQVNGSVMTIWLSAGSTIADHSVQFQIITAAGRHYNITVWVRVQPIAGDTAQVPPLVVGPPGASALVGVGAPTGSIGISGDSYINSATGEVWKKGLAGWVDTGTTLPTTAAETARAEAAEALLTPLTNPLLTGALQGSNNLGDVPNKPAALVNLGAYPASNPAGYVTAGQAAAGAPVQSVFGRTGQVALTSPDVVGALGFTPYSASNPAGYIFGNQTITLSGDAAGAGATSIAVTLPSVNTSGAGAFSNITVDAKGRVTAIRNLAGADVTAALGFTPANVSALSAETTRAELAEQTALQAAQAAAQTAGAALPANAIGAYAPLASPSLTGIPTAPTAAPGTASNQLATTAFDAAAIGAERTRAQTAETGLGNLLGSYAPTASPTLTGTPTAPTQAPGTSNTTLATTAFDSAAVAAEKARAQAAETAISAAAMTPAQAAAIYAPLASPALSGTPTAPTQAAGTNNNTLATTGFATGAVGVETARAEAAEQENQSAAAAAQTKANAALPASAITSYAPLASPSLSGTPTAPTAAPGTTGTQLATVDFATAAATAEKARAMAAESAIQTSTASSIAAVGQTASAALTPGQAAATYAPIASPALTGVPTAPTAAAGATGHQLATLDFAGGAVATEAARAQAAEAANHAFAVAAQGTASAALTPAGAAALYAPIASPTLTGTPIAPTPGSGAGAGQIATVGSTAAAVAVETTRAQAAEQGNATAAAQAYSLAQAANALAAAGPTASSLSALAPLNSPALTGTPTAPTQPAGTSNTTIATTAFNAAAVAAEKARAQGVEATLTQGQTTTTQALASLAPINNANLTGAPTAPTPATGSSGQQIATAAFTAAAVATETTRATNAETSIAQVANGALQKTAATNQYAPLVSPSLSGTPTAPTAAAGTVGNQLATVGFTGNAVATETQRAQTAETSISTTASQALTKATAAAAAASGAITTVPSGSLLGGVNGALSPVNLGTGLAIASNAVGLAADGVTAGTFSNITVDTYGRITAVRSISGADVTAAMVANGVASIAGVIVGGTGTPTLTGCGTKTAANPGSSDIIGNFTVGSNATCTLKFNKPKTAAFTIVVSDRAGGFQPSVTPLSDQSGFTVANPALAGTTVDYFASGN